MRRLKSKNLLRVNDVKHFIDAEHDGRTDVYVGVFDDFAQTQFASRIAEWGYANTADQQKDRSSWAMRLSMSFTISTLRNIVSPSSSRSKD